MLCLGVTVALRPANQLMRQKVIDMSFFSEASDNVHEAQGVGEMMVVMGDFMTWLLQTRTRLLKNKAVAVHGN